MKLGARGIHRTAKALLQKEHYVALWNTLWVYDHPFRNLWRYLTARGDYPYSPAVRTPLGKVYPTLYSFHDLLTVNEIFCRKDYPAAASASVVVDIGSNIGISTLYFLTRNPQSRCYLYEPDPNNVAKLKYNLKDYHNRYVLHQKAVSYHAGKLAFGLESTGRYGGIGLKTKDIIEVDTVSINQVLESVLAKEIRIDVLKLDIEGLEEETVAAIDGKYLPRIRRIYMEYLSDTPLPNLFPKHFVQVQRGSICQFINRHTK